MLSVTTVLKTMLYRSLEEFEKEFTEYFQRQKKAQEGVTLSSSKNGDENSNSFRDFCKRINNALSSPKASEKVLSKLLQSQATTFSCSRSCKNVTVLRSSFAHNIHMPRMDILCGLEEIRGLTAAFGLSSERTASAIRGLNSISGEQNQVCCEVLKFQGDTRSLQNRILRL